jgi:hypothetical protein
MRYSARRKAIAPSCILLAIFDIRSVPSGIEFTSLVFHHVKSKARRPKAGMARRRVSKFMRKGCAVNYLIIDQLMIEKDRF